MVADILSNVLDESNAPAFEATAQVSGGHFAFLLIGISDLILIKSAVLKWKLDVVEWFIYSHAQLM